MGGLRGRPFLEYQPSIARRPASVIVMRTTSTVLPLASTGSPTIAAASPSWTSPASVLVSNPWAITSRSPVAPSGSRASTSSDRRCSRVRRRWWRRDLVDHPSACRPASVIMTSSTSIVCSPIRAVSVTTGRNVDKPLQDEVFVWCHVVPSRGDVIEGTLRADGQEITDC